MHPECFWHLTVNSPFVLHGENNSMSVNDKFHFLGELSLEAFTLRPQSHKGSNVRFLFSLFPFLVMTISASSLPSSWQPSLFLCSHILSCNYFLQTLSKHSLAPWSQKYVLLLLSSLSVTSWWQSVSMCTSTHISSIPHSYINLHLPLLFSCSASPHAIKTCNNIPCSVAPVFYIQWFFTHYPTGRPKPRAIVPVSQCSAVATRLWYFQLNCQSMRLPMHYIWEFISRDS